MTSARAGMIVVGLAAVIACLGGFASPAAKAAVVVVQLEDLNSKAWIEVNGPRGMYDWTVDGVDNLKQQWFWYRVGDTGPEQSLDTLPVTYSFTTNTLSATYTGAGFAIDIAYTLMGGTPGSHTADIGETIRIRNTGTTAVEMHFFQYSDFDLIDTPDDDVVHISGVLATQWDSTQSISETSAIRQANRWEVGYYSTTLDKLNDGDADNLDNSTGPLGPDPVKGLYNVTWAFQWDVTIDPGKTYFISKDKLLTLTVPEPATLGLLAFGGVAFLVIPVVRRSRANRAG